MNGGRFWILDKDGRVVPATIGEWRAMHESNSYVVARDEPADDIIVSTIMLGIDYSFDTDDPPLFFETVISGGAQDGYQERYSKKAEALAGHAKALSISTIPLEVA